MVEVVSNSPLGHPMYRLQALVDCHSVRNVCGLAVFYHNCGNVCFVEVDGHEPSRPHYYLHSDVTFQNLSDAEMSLLQAEAAQVAVEEEGYPAEAVAT